MTSKTTNKFSPEVRARAVRMVLDHEGEHPSGWAAIMSISGKIGCTGQTLNEWVKKAEVDGGRKPGLATDMAAKLKTLERENRELRQANEILRKASAYFAQAELDRPSSDDRFHRRSLKGLWGRADLQSAADRPVNLPRSCLAPWRSDQALDPGEAGCCPVAGGPAVFRRELPGLWRAQGLAADEARGTSTRSLHRGAPDAKRGSARCDPRKAHAHHGGRQGGAVPARSCEPGFPCAGAKHALGLGLHLCQHLVGLRLRCLRHRRLRPSHRWLARIPDRKCQLRARRAGAGPA